MTDRPIAPASRPWLTQKRITMVLLGGALALMVTGCFFGRSRPRGGHHGHKRCPPGHVWEDGGCHKRGKGHDPNKHHGKRRR